MINEKQKILEVINELPDDTTWDEAMYSLYLHSKLQKSKEDIKNGRVITLEELDRERGATYGNYSVKRSKTRYE